MAAITPSPLPTLDSPRIKNLGWNENFGYFQAYVNVLQAESHALRLQTDAGVIRQARERQIALKEANGKLVSIRVAGYLLLEFGTHSGVFGAAPSAALVKWLTSPPQNPQSNQLDVIIETGTLVREKFIRVFRTGNTAYSQPSSHPSRPSFDTLEDMIKDSMESTGTDYRTFRNKMLVRDSYRCVITGILDEASVERCPRLAEGSNASATTLEAAHIFNEGTMQGIDPAVSEDSQSRLLNKTRTASGALSILESFGFSKFTDAFKQAGGVHEVWNLLTLEHNLHVYFDRLKLWFEYTEQPHCYKVCTLYPHQTNLIVGLCKIVDPNRVIGDHPITVEFNARLEDVPPPDPLLLALHAMCARVAHMSGAAEFFDQIERDTEDIMVLAFDGSSAPLLSNLLSSHVVIPSYGGTEEEQGEQSKLSSNECGGKDEYLAKQITVGS